ncbi:MAG: DMT family transporter, partial [Planctomycetes bacterium]|nr:DMT family transporter [Planctomycetota bacterium]
FIRGVLISLFLVIVARRRGAPLWGKRRGLLFLRGLLGSMALLIYYRSAQILPLGDAVLLQYTNPIWVAVLAPVFLHERTNPRHYWAVGLAILGVAIVAHPEGRLAPESLLALGGALCSAFAYLTVRVLVRTERATTIMLWFPATSVVLTLPVMVALGKDVLPQTGLQWWGSLLVTVTALLGQWTLTLGLARAPAARATATTLAGPVFGVVWGLMLLGEVPGTHAWVGALLVMAALAVISRR